MKALTEKVVKKYLADPYAVDLSEFTSVEDSAARLLCTCDGDIWLDGLTALSDGSARILAAHDGALVLRFVKSLSESAAKALASHKGELLITGVESLSEAEARALSSYKGELNLSGLATLTEGVARALATHKGQLILNGITSLSEQSAKALATHKGPLYLDGLTRLSDEAAGHLAKHHGDVSLMGVKSVSRRGTKALAEHKGKIVRPRAFTFTGNKGRFAVTIWLKLTYGCSPNVFDGEDQSSWEDGQKALKKARITSAQISRSIKQGNINLSLTEDAHEYAMRDGEMKRFRGLLKAASLSCDQILQGEFSKGIQLRARLDLELSKKCSPEDVEALVSWLVSDSAMDIDFPGADISLCYRNELGNDHTPMHEYLDSQSS